MQRLSYTELTELVWQNGIEMSPRGLTTHEVLNTSISFSPITLIARSKMNVRLAWLEALMLAGGFFDIGLIAKTAPNANLKLYEYQSDYGTRTYAQLLAAQELLLADSSSRRAVLYLNDRDTPGYNCACTTSIQFLVRNQMLFTTVSMRSWDLVFGMPIDIVMFGFLAQMLANSLGIVAAEVVVHAASAHIYQSTRDLAKEVSAPSLIVLSDPLFYNQPIEDLSRYCRWEAQRFAEGPSKVLPFIHTRHMINEPRPFGFATFDPALT